MEEVLAQYLQSPEGAQMAKQLAAIKAHEQDESYTQNALVCNCQEENEKKIIGGSLNTTCQMNNYYFSCYFDVNFILQDEVCDLLQGTDPTKLSHKAKLALVEACVGLPDHETIALKLSPLVDVGVFVSLYYVVIFLSFFFFCSVTDIRYHWGYHQMQPI
jgi:hypothetical protein